VLPDEEGAALPDAVEGAAALLDAEVKEAPVHDQSPNEEEAPDAAGAVEASA